MDRKKIIAIVVIALIAVSSVAYFGWSLLTSSRSSRADEDKTVTVSLEPSTNVAAVGDTFIVKLIASQQTGTSLSLLDTQVRYTTRTLKFIGFEDIVRGCNNLAYLQPDTITNLPTTAAFTVTKVANIDASTVTFPTGNFCFSALKFQRIADDTPANVSDDVANVEIGQVSVTAVSGTGEQVPLVISSTKKSAVFGAPRPFSAMVVRAVISTVPVARGPFKLTYSCVPAVVTPTTAPTTVPTTAPTVVDPEPSTIVIMTLAPSPTVPIVDVGVTLAPQCVPLYGTCVSAAGATTGTCCASLRCTIRGLSGSAEKICKAPSSGGGGGGGQLPDVVTVTVAPTATRTPTPVPCIPTLTTPLNASTFTGANPTFVWSTCAGVGVRYKLDVFAGTTSFKSVIQSATSYAFTGQQLPVWTRGAVYSWKVKKCIDADCVGGTYSATRTFIYNPPLDAPTATSIPTRTPTPTILAACLMLNQACENISGTSLGTCCAGMSCQSTALGSMVDKTCQATSVASGGLPTATPRVQPNGGNLTLISAETDAPTASAGIIELDSPDLLSKSLSFETPQMSCSLVTQTTSDENSGPSLASFPEGSRWVTDMSMFQETNGTMSYTVTYRVVSPDVPDEPLPTTPPDDEEITPTPPPDEDLGTPTPTPVSDEEVDPSKVTLRMKVKLQGVNPATLSSQYNRLTFSVAIGGSTLSENTAYESSVFTSRGGGVYEGQFAFDPSIIVPGDDYKILVKGPKHLARRFCIASPTGGFNYFCPAEAGKITLRQGLNTFDFSKVNLLAGDLPIDNVQDGVIDSSDLTIVRQYLGSKLPDVIRVADVNFDGIVDTQDYILIISNTLVNEDEQ